MSLVLRLTRKTDPQWRQERRFGQEEIVIGRRASHKLALEDTNRQISRDHARIVWENEQYSLTDLGSRNGTALNNRRLSPNHPYPLKTGDVILIGEYRIEVSVVLPEPQEDTEETAFLENPFGEEARILAQLLARIRKKYHRESPNHRETALELALQSALADSDMGECERILAKRLIGKKDVSNPPAEEKIPLPGTSPPLPQAQLSQSGQLLKLFMGYVLGMVRSVWKFRQEFLGMTLPQMEYSLHLFSPEELIGKLLSNRTPPAARQQELNFMKAQIEEALLHPLGLLEGYRVSVDEGVRQVLMEINPAKIEQEVARQSLSLGPLKIPCRAIPLWVPLKAYAALKKQLFDLLQEGRGTFESRIFRPAFVHAYMKTISSARKEEAGASGSDYRGQNKES
ncbi:MAG: FHA domain-containing protein [Calditrichaeota bacterium]|nr:MAG: FHA domain-containing protein [Calditrichota bacterium]